MLVAVCQGPEHVGELICTVELAETLINIVTRFDGFSDLWEYATKETYVFAFGRRCLIHLLQEADRYRIRIF
jgi:hypothetical protein